MEHINDAMKHVDPELTKLITASHEFRQYRETTIGSVGGLSLKGSLSIEINPRHPLGLTITPREK